MTAVDQYTNQLHSELKYYAAWLPGNPIRLGTIGTMQGNRFIPQDHLSNHGFRVRIEPDKTHDLFEYQTKNGIEVAGKAAGSLSPAMPNVAKGKAGLTLKFKRSDVVWFAASDCRIDRIANQLELGDVVKKLYQAKPRKWNRDWVVVTHLVTSKHATILISATKGATAELEVKAKSDFNLAKAEASTRSSLKSDSSMAIKIVAAQGLTPLFGLMEVSDGWKQWWTGSGPTTGPKRGRRARSRPKREPAVLKKMR